MKKFLLLSVLCVIIIGTVYYFACRLPDPPKQPANISLTEASATNTVKEGDLIFQTSLSAQSTAIQQATSSRYSHCGLIHFVGKEPFVFEAVGPVKLTPLQEWIDRGKDRYYAVKRLKNAEAVLTPNAITQMKQVGKKYIGKPYDIYFGWSDESIYCSELIWKIYHQATGIEIGKLEKLKDFDLSGKAVRTIMNQRYGDKIPLEETVISPAALFNSPLLETIKL